MGPLKSPHWETVTLNATILVADLDEAKDLLEIKGWKKVE